jgi:DNA repair protein RadC
MGSGLKDANVSPDLFQHEAPQPPRPAAKAHHEGHRGRLRDRFNKEPEAMPDYELLELVLQGAVARKDTKPEAKRLLDEFGTFAEVISAPRERLMEVKGIGETSVTRLKVVQAAAQRLMEVKLKERDAFRSWEEVVKYCQAKMGRESIEQFRVLFLDKKNRLIANELQQRGTVDHTPAYPREIVKRALELSAMSIILVHNHPTRPTSITLNHATTY